MAELRSSVMGAVCLGADGEVAEARRELHSWRAMVEKAEDLKARLILDKFSEEEAMKEARVDLYTLLEKQKHYTKQDCAAIEEIQEDILKLERGNMDLKERLKRRQSELEEKMADLKRLKNKSKIYAKIPQMKMKFMKKEDEDVEDSGHTIRGVFIISQRPRVLLQGGNALITFKEETVAAQMLKMAKCSVSCDGTTLEVKPKRLVLNPSVKFEIHLDVSKKTVRISNVLSIMPEERMKDQLEISFSKPSRGGGEVEKVDYDGTSGKGRITFLSIGVAESLALMGKYPLDLDNNVNVKVDPVYSFKLSQFQAFDSAPKRTILLDNIIDIGDEEDLQDYLEIHFQKPTNYGGEVEMIKYISKGKQLQAFFIEDSKRTEE